jgi:outer membrane protein TolC
MTRTAKALYFCGAVLASVLSTTHVHAESTRAATFDELIEAELAEKDGLSADDAARAAVRTSPEVQAKNSELAAAAADLDRATLAYLPTTSVTARYARYSPVSSAPLRILPTAPPIEFTMPLNQTSFSASLLVPVSDYFLRVTPNRAGARKNRDAAAWGSEFARQNALADARIAYYSWVNAKLRVVVAEQALEQARAHLGLTRTLLDAGNASEADALRFESLVAKSEQMLASARNLSELTEQELRTKMHAAPEAGFHIGEDIRQPPSLERHAPLAALWREALALRADLAALDAAQGARAEGITTDRAGYLPRFDLFADGQYSNPNPRVFPVKDEFQGSWDAGAQLTWTISELPTTAARVRASEARYAAKAAERAELVDRIRDEVTQAREDSELARISLDTTARGLGAAEESYRTRRLLFENGRASAVELIDAETDLTSARLDALGARIDVRATEVRLAYAVGRSRCLTPGVHRTTFGPGGEDCP